MNLNNKIFCFIKLIFIYAIIHCFLYADFTNSADSFFYFKSFDSNRITGVMKEQECSYRIDNFTAVIIEGALSDLKDLKPGMKLILPPLTPGSYINRIRCNDKNALFPDKLILLNSILEKPITLKDIKKTPRNWNNEMTLTFFDDGTEVVYKVNNDTLVYLHGAARPLSQITLFVGNKFLQPQDAKPKTLLKAITYYVPNDSNIYVKSIDKNQLMVIIKGEDRTYRFDALTSVIIHKELKSISDLKPGMKLTMSPLASGSYLSRIECEDMTIYNEKLKTEEQSALDSNVYLKSINDKQVVVVVKEKELMYQTDDSTAVTILGKSASLNDLKPGMKLRIPSVTPNSYLPSICCDDVGVYKDKINIDQDKSNFIRFIPSK